MTFFSHSLRVLAKSCETKGLYAATVAFVPHILTQQPSRHYAAKKKALTEAQIQLQKHAAEMGFKEKTTIRATLFEYHDVEESIKYMKSEGSCKEKNEN